MELIVLAAVLCVCGALYYWGRRARDSEVRVLHDHLTGMRRELEQAKAILQQQEAALKEAKAANDQLYAFGMAQIKNIRQDGALLPSLVRWADQLQEEYDRQRSHHAQLHYASAPVAANRVREANARARLAERECNELRNRVTLYEAQAPWLRDYAELTVEEILAGLRLDEDVGNAIDQGEDPSGFSYQQTSGPRWTRPRVTNVRLIATLVAPGHVAHGQPESSMSAMSVSVTSGRAGRLSITERHGDERT